MRETAPGRMTAEAFRAWAMARPEGERCELADGEVIALAPERPAHHDARFLIARHLAAAVEAARVPCRVQIDGMAVRVVIHHRRDEAGAIMTSILGDGPLLLDPPGVGFDPFG